MASPPRLTQRRTLRLMGTQSALCPTGPAPEIETSFSCLALVAYDLSDAIHNAALASCIANEWTARSQYQQSTRECRQAEHMPSNFARSSNMQQRFRQGGQRRKKQQLTLRFSISGRTQVETCLVSGASSASPHTSTSYHPPPSMYAVRGSPPVRRPDSADVPRVSVWARRDDRPEVSDGM